MKALKQFIPVILILALGCLFLAFSPQTQKKGKPWDIPEKYVKMTNPYQGDASLLKIGRLLYSKHCKSCHGSKGKGDGSKAPQLETFPGDFTSAEFKNYTDGELYYMTYVGRDEMKPFDKKIRDEEDQWAVIMYIKTLK